jgi:hypothetical protein
LLFFLVPTSSNISFFLLQVLYLHIQSLDMVMFVFRTISKHLRVLNNIYINASGYNSNTKGEVKYSFHDLHIYQQDLAQVYAA